MSIYYYLNNNPDKFHTDPIWNDGAFWRGRPTEFYKKNIGRPQQEQEEQNNFE